MNTKIPIRFIDELRGIAAFLVLFQHTFDNIFPKYDEWSSSFLNIGLSGVVILFLISGYVIPHTVHNKTPFSFLLNRVFRIFPLYITALFLRIVGAHWWTNENPDISTILANVFLIQHLHFLHFKDFIGASWSLFLEIVFYILFALFWKLNLLKKHRNLIIFTISVIVFSVLYGLIRENPVSLKRQMYLFITLFSMCKYLSKFDASFQSSSREAIIHFSVIFIGIFIWILTSKDDLFSSLSIFCSWTLGYLFFFYFPKIRIQPFLSQILSWMGKMSYSTYLIKGSIFRWMLYFEAPPLVFFMSLPLTYLVAPFFYHYIEQPGIRLGKWVLTNFFSKTAMIKDSS